MYPKKKRATSRVAVLINKNEIQTSLIVFINKIIVKARFKIEKEHVTIYCIHSRIEEGKLEETKLFWEELLQPNKVIKTDQVTVYGDLNEG